LDRIVPATPSTFREDVSVRIEVSTQIAAEPAAVFAVVADYTQAPRWQRATTAAAWITDPPTRVGSRHRQTTRFLGRDMSAAYEVTALEPGRSITIRSIDAPFPMIVTRTVEAVNGGARVTEISEGGPTGLARAIAPVMAPMARRSIRRDYERLRRLLEA
jgi:uncharacterized protein YndB with AHSA1/START domain